MPHINTKLTVRTPEHYIQIDAWRPGHVNLNLASQQNENPYRPSITVTQVPCTYQLPILSPNT